MELSWVLLPKGVEDGRFHFSVMAVFDQRTFNGAGPFTVGTCSYTNWAELISAQLAGFTLDGSALTQSMFVEVSVGHVDKAIWQLAFPADLPVATAKAGRTPASARVVLRDGTADTVEAAEALADLTVGIQAGVVSLASRVPWLAALPGSALLDEGEWMEASVDQSTLRAYREDYHALANLYLPPKPSVNEAAPPVITLKDAALEALRNHIIDMNRPAVDPTSQKSTDVASTEVFDGNALQRLADEIGHMRVDDEGMAIRRASAAPVADAPLTQTAVRHVIATVPCGARHLDAKQAHTQASRMAALMGEPGLLPYVGLVFDAHIALSIGRGALSATPQWKCVGVPGFMSRSPWTAVDADGVAQGDPAGDGIMDARGLLRVGSRSSSEPDFLLSDHRFDEALRQAMHKAKGERNHSPRIAPGTNRALERDLEFNDIRSHDLCIHWRGRALASQQRRRGTAMLSDEPVLYREQLVTGIRPMLGRVRKGNTEWFNLCERKVTYRALGSAPGGPDSADRDDSIVPLISFDARSNETSSVQDLLCGWSGWGIGTPLPSGAEPHAHLFGKHEIANKRSLPPFLFGEDVWLAARLVYRDGSSAVGTDRAVQLLQKDEDNKSELRIGRRDDPALPFRLLRWERLQAPQALFPRTYSGEGWWGIPSPTVIRVATSPYRGRPELRRSSRVLVAGAEPDMWTVWKHGVYHAVDPATSAYADIARGHTGLDFPTVEVGSVKAPVFRQRAPGESAPAVPYHPDPLVKGLVLMLVRRRHPESSRVIPVVDQAGEPVILQIPFYEGRRWPHARTIHLHVDATRRRYADRPALRRDGVTDVIVRVPAGERFSVLAYPYADANALEAAHAFGGDRLRRGVAALNLTSAVAWFDSMRAASQEVPVYEPYLANAVVLDVEHVRERPEARPTVTLTKAGEEGERSRDQTAQPLAGEVRFDPGSTATVEVHATWRQPVGDLRRRLAGEAIEEVSVLVMRTECEAEPELLDRGAHGTPLVRPPQSQAIACDHEFKDHRHRLVAYWARGLGRTPQTPTPRPIRGEINATPRLRDGHREGLRVLQGSGGAGLLRVLASRRPEPPQVEYLVPAFATDTVQRRGETRRRRSGRLSLHLGGSWYSSGEGEMLAVVLLSPEEWGAYADLRSRFDSVASFWGADPLKQHPAALSRLPDMLTEEHFEAGTLSKPHVLPGSHPRAGAKLDLVLFEPIVCRESQSWRVELPLLNPSAVSRPMVRFALARYQPHALAGLELSDIVLADYIQMSDTREAVIVRDPRDRRRVLVTVNGNSFDGSDESGRASMRCWLERRCGRARDGVSAWVREGEEAGCERVWREGRFCWSASLRSETSLRSGRYRVAIEESERYRSHGEREHGELTTYFDLVPVA